jgi:hypothetical protein
MNRATRTPRAYRRALGGYLSTLVRMEVLAREEWLARARAHEGRVDPWVRPHLERRRAGVAHPVEDFLFTYYSQRPAALRRWHPGYGVVLAEAPEYVALKGYQALVANGRGGPTARVSRAYLLSQRLLLERTASLLVATASRPATFGCLGLHEWAMVYRQPPGRTRHAAWPLRLGAEGTDAVVESHRVVCTHFDAFRFFTPDARTLNVVQPGRDDRAELEQPGCLHAGMDLYKHAFRLTPLVPTELVADCFALAREIRVLDMRASPYDLRRLGYEPVRIESPEGKREYAAAQRRFAERAAPLRARLLGEVERLLDVAS